MKNRFYHEVEMYIISAKVKVKILILRLGMSLLLKSGLSMPFSVSSQEFCFPPLADGLEVFYVCLAVAWF